MRSVFAELSTDARRAGRRASALLLMKEVVGLTRFAIRERLSRLKDWQPSGGWHPLRELHWAWRAVRARGWRAAFVVALLAIVLAANTVVFSVTDALVLNTLPYRDPDRLVTLGMTTHSRLLELRAQPDLFAEAHGYLPGVTYLTGKREPAAINTAFITPGLLAMLGAAPLTGRDFTPEDMIASEPSVAIVADDLAHDRFGTPAAAVGRLLETDGRPLLVVGVTPAGFRFPDGETRLWRALDHSRYSGTGVIVSGFTGFWPVARLAEGVPIASANREIAARIPELAPRSGRSALNLLAFGNPTEARERLLFALLGAAVCLLLTAGANIANVELAGALRRRRIQAIQAALGASQATLARTAILEGALLVAGSTAAAAALALAGIEIVASRLPERFTSSAVNPIDLDWRAGAFMAAIAAAAWLIATLPVLLSNRTLRLAPTLQIDARSAASRPTTLLRQLLTVGQVSLAVILVVGGLLFARTYLSLLDVDRGADTTNVATISLTLPPEAFASPAQVDAVAAEVMARVAAHPDVIAATRLFGPAPPATGFAMRSQPEVDGRSIGTAELTALIYNVDSSFFETLGLPVRLGRAFDATDPPTSAVISESMARWFWPEQNPIGRTFQISPSYPRYTVVGVVPHVRNHRDAPGGPSESTFTFYLPSPARTPDNRRLQRGPTAAAPAVNVPAALRARVVTFLVRLTGTDRLDTLVPAARGDDTRFQLRAELLDAQYAGRHVDRLLAASTVASFAVLALTVTMGGVYAVMAFLVAGRTREIGVRMALGANRRDVRRLVFGSSLRWVGIGAALGLCGAAASSRWIESQLFGVSPIDLTTYLGAGAVIIFMAALATWLPARRAASVDPALTLRTH
jgi:predicted permease